MRCTKLSALRVEKYNGSRKHLRQSMVLLESVGARQSKLKVIGNFYLVYFNDAVS